MHTLGRDFVHAVRAIVRMPALAAVVILSLGVGIGVNTAVFSWIQAIVLQPLPGVPESGRYYLVEPRAATGSFPGVSWLEYRDLQERLGSFQGLLSFRITPLNVGEPSRTERVFGLLVSQNYFSALGLRPALGRFLGPEDVRSPGREPVAVISHDFWQTRFQGAPDALGQTLRVNNQELTVVGVVPQDFQGTVTGLQFDLWVPATLAPALIVGSRELEDRNQRGYVAMGRLAPGATAVDAQAELTSAMQDLARTYPETNATMEAEVLALGRAPRGPLRMLVVALGFLQAVMLLVLLAVCGNTANLMLARASSRHREIGVRLALGAGPFRVVRLMLVESLVLALGGALLGVLIAVWGTDALRAMPAYGAFPLRFQTRVDSLGLAVALLLGVGSGLLFGAAPAVQLARVDLQRALRIGVGVGGRSVVRNALMGIQVGLALLVLAVAALFFQGFVETRDTDPGFRSEGVLLATYDLTGRFDQDTYRRQFAARLLERLHTSPAVESSGISSSVPLDIHGLPLRSFLLEGRAQAQAAPDQALANTVTPGYFRTMGIPFVAGADFADLDDASAPPQAIVNEEFVRRFAAGAEPVGRRLESRGRTFVIAGVVRNSLYEAFGEPATPIIYFSYRDRASAMGEVHLRARAGAELALASEVQRAVHDLDPSLPVYNIRTLTEHIDRNLMLRRIPARMFVVIGPLLLVLVAFGIYGVVAYVVAHRTAEIGVRLALGASTRRVVRQIVGESFRPIAIGAFLGWAGALVIDMHLFRGASLDLVVLLTVPAILLGVALFASWLPARRASAVDPVATLRSE